MASGALDYRAIVAGGVVVVVLYWLIKREALGGLRAASDFARDLGDAITFDPASLGPDLEVTAGAQERAQEYIDQGYAEYVDGVFRVTPEGEAYIRAQTVDRS